MKEQDEILNIESTLKLLLQRVAALREKIIPNPETKRRRPTKKETGAAKATAANERRKQRVIKQVIKQSL